MRLAAVGRIHLKFYDEIAGSNNKAYFSMYPKDRHLGSKAAQQVSVLCVLAVACACAFLRL